MHVVVLGVSHLTAAVEVRERVSFVERQIVPALGQLLGQPDLLEAVLLSTCNRTEIYAVTRDPEAAREAISSFWQEHRKLPAGLLQEHAYFYVDEEALRHLHRVTAGIDSQIVGESQILGQVKVALAAAQACDAAGPFLDSLFQQAIKSGKQIRTETHLDRGALSVSSAAVEVALGQLGDLQDRIVLVYGAGKMSTLTVKALFGRGVRHIYITNRTFERAQEAASQIGGEAIPFETARLLHAAADILICCTSAPHYLITPENFPVVPGRQRLLFDIAVPRNIDPALAERPGVTVIDLDGLSAVAARNRAERMNQMSAAEELVEMHVRAHMSRFRSYEVAPTIEAFVEQVESLCQRELERSMRETGPLTTERAALERLSHGLLHKFMHGPLQQLREAGHAERQELAAALSRLFNLQVEDPTARYLRKRIPQVEKARQLAGVSAE